MSQPRPNLDWSTPDLDAALADSLGNPTFAGPSGLGISSFVLSREALSKTRIVGIFRAQPCCRTTNASKRSTTICQGTVREARSVRKLARRASDAGSFPNESENADQRDMRAKNLARLLGRSVG